MLDQQAIETMRPFDGPIPGQSLTNSPESQQAYEGAPEFTNVRAATSAIFASLLEESMLMEVCRMMAKETPIGDITKMLLVSGLSQGKWNPDLMLLLVEPVMYILLAIAERVGIRDVKLYDGEEEDEELDAIENQEIINSTNQYKNELKDPQRFSDLKTNVAPDQIPEELITQLENIDVSNIQESLMARPQAPEMAEDSLMARR